MDDAEHPSSVWTSTDILSWIYSDSQVNHQVAVTDRWGFDAHRQHGGYYAFGCGNDLREDFEPADIREKWETCVTLGRSLGYNRFSGIDDYVSSRDLIHDMIDEIIRGGNYLIAVSPNADGQIPVIEQDRLNALGQWLKVNGEAVYGTRPWRIRGEGSSVRYTRSGNVIYAILLNWPGTELILDEPNPSHYSRFSLLGRDGSLRWERIEDQVLIHLPELAPDEMPCDFAWVVKMTVIN
jgi:alpha-L-fucosidase